MHGIYQRSFYCLLYDLLISTASHTGRAFTRKELNAFLKKPVTIYVQTGQEFSAADLTFCALIKLLTNVPFFIDNPRFQAVFEYREQIREKYDPKYADIDNFVEIFFLLDHDNNCEETIRTSK